MTAATANYHEFTALPPYTAPQWTGEGNDRKLLNQADPYKWSGTKAPPAIGAKVRLYVNRFGTGTVVTYFAEYGWLGIKVKLDKPPAWWTKQTKERGKDPKTTLAHFFGVDLEPRPKA